MKIISTPLPGCYLIEPKVFHDHRGYFFESFNLRRFCEGTGLDIEFVQDNQSFSAYGVLRGLHFQHAPHAQAKLVTVLEGEVLDVCVDLRKGSPSFGGVYSVILSGENKKQLFIPRGFAHGFAVKSPTALFHYKCDNYYTPGSEGGIRFDDPTLAIDWEIPSSQLKLSPKDLALPAFDPTQSLFMYSGTSVIYST